MGRRLHVAEIAPRLSYHPGISTHGTAPGAVRRCKGFRMAARHRHNLRLAMPAAFIACLVAAAVAPAGPATRARPLGIAGSGQTTLALVDAHWVGGAQPAAGGDLRLYRPATGSLASTTTHEVPKRGWVNVVPGAPSDAEAGAYSGRLLVSERVVARAQHRWPESGGRAADVVGSPLLDRIGDVWVPLVVAGHRGETTVVSLQSRSPSTATFEVTVMPLGAALPEATTTYSVAPNAAVAIDLGLDPAFIALRPNAPDGFIGTMRIHPVGDAIPVVHALVDVAETAAVYDFAGVPAERGTTALFVPLVHAALPDDPSLGPEATRLAVVNVGDDGGDVRVSYVGFGGTCAGQTIAHPPFQLAAGAMTVVDQGDGAGLPTGPSGLPAGCLATALISADQPIAATLIARQTRDGRTLAAATNALRRDDGASSFAELAVPWFAADDNGTALDSDLLIMNLEGTFASATVHFATADGTLLDCGAPCRRVIAPFSSWRLRSAALPAELRALAGGAVVAADGARIVAIVRSAPADGSGDAVLWPAVFRRLTTTDDDTGPGTWLPLVLRAAPPSDTATATPKTPPALPSATPPPTVPPFAPGGGTAGGALSTLLLANLEDSPAFLAADLFLVQGSGTVSGTKIGPTRIVRDQPPLRPHALALAALEDVGLGRYAAIVVGGHAVGAVARTEWTGGAAVLAEPAGEAFELAVPFAPQGAAGETGVLSIHNPAATFLVNVHAEFLDRAGQQVGSQTVAVGPNAVFRLAVAAPAAFDGWARLTSDRPFGAHMLVDAAASARGAYDVGAVRVSDAAAKLLTPRVVRGVAAAGPLGGAGSGARRNTRLVVANPGATGVVVRPAYLGTAGTCAGFRLSGAPFGVAAGANRVVDIGAEPAMPVGCTASATLTTLDGGIIGIAIESVSSAAGGWTVAADRLMAAADAGGRWLVPRLLTGRDGRATTIHVMNAGDTVVNIALGAYDVAGGALACAGCSAALPAGAAVAFDGRAVVGAAAAPGAWAEITADGPVVATYAETSDDGLHDDAMAAAVRILPRPAVPPARLLVPQLEKTVDAGPVPTATRTPTATATRSVAGTATPGGGKVTLLAVAVVNVTGNDDPACAACDGTYDDADRAAAARSPLPALTFVVRNAAGDEVARQRSISVDRIEIAPFSLGAPDAGGYDVSIEALPGAWLGCPNSPAVRHLAAVDFPLGSAKVDFHLSNTCLPSNRPPLEPVQIPGATPTAGPDRMIAYMPALRR